MKNNPIPYEVPSIDAEHQSIVSDYLLDTYGSASLSLDPMVTIGQIDDGIPVSVLRHVIAGFDLSAEEAASILHINVRTIQRFTDDSQLLKPDLAERVAFLHRLLIFAVDMLGSKAVVSSYLRGPVMALDGKRPLDYLGTIVGMQIIYDEIGRIAHGVY